MPISGPSSFLPMAREIVNHWQGANTQLAALHHSPITLPGGVTQAQFGQKVDMLETLVQSLTLHLQQEQLGRADRDAHRLEARELVRRFRTAVQHHLPGSIYAHSLPDLPQELDAEGVYRVALTRIKALWAEIDGLNEDEVPGFVAPLVLGEGTTCTQGAERAGFAEVTFLRLAQFESQSELLRVERDQLWTSTLKPLMKHYRTAVVNAFGPHHAIVASVPRLAPVSKRRAKVASPATAPVV